MHFVALISGGKDGLYAAREAQRVGHTLVAFANLAPAAALAAENADNAHNHDTGTL